MSGKWVKANDSWRMPDKAVLVLYQDDDFILGRQNGSCYSAPDQKKNSQTPAAGT